MSPEHPREGDSVTFTATVSNQGDRVTPRYRVGFFVDEQAIGMGLDTLGLAPGATAQVVSPQWPAIAGAHKLRAHADQGDVVDEKDEDNNALSLDLTVGPPTLPDLVVEALATQPLEPKDGEKVTLLATVANRGEAPAGPFRVLFRVDGEATGEAAVDALAPGATMELRSGNWLATKGEHRLAAEADPGNRVAETREDNNQRTSALQVGPLPMPDLVVASLLVEPMETREGDQLVLTAKLTNDGDADAGPFRVAFLVDGDRIGLADAETLAAGASIEVTSPAWTATEGQHTATAVADDEAQVAEAHEDNNERTRDFTVHTQDRAILGVTMSVEACREGRSGSADVSVGGWLGIDVHVGDPSEPAPCTA